MLNKIKAQERNNKKRMVMKAAAIKLQNLKNSGRIYKSAVRLALRVPWYSGVFKDA